MLRVFIGTQLSRTPYDIAPATTLRDAFDMAEVDYASGTVLLDGSPLKAGDIDKTFAELGKTERAILIVTKKLDNANA